ncbi:hypothetical protein [Candidatus Oleimmundimicrobium sp.]|uniref:hypothetical protein n=1 Tax=Candidatus Oleimmundimicrobium sp. TaxID=3060597 RepID=UPI002726C515|nr:hypothetical protein [Candidatus Oleimmundimicrobium sp.]MDO8885740.1 hypothetical protein [Candidatus Oleimmundimicrobium sp.]
MKKDNFMEGIFTKPIGEQLDELAEKEEKMNTDKKIKEFLADKKRKIIREILDYFLYELTSGSCDCGWGEDIYEMIIGKDNFEDIMEGTVKKLEGNWREFRWIK